mgnify:CR=1 FL=1
MKLTAKIAALAALAVATAVTFTGCPESFGKDDFFGTWETEYVYPSSSDDANASQSYNSDNAGATYNIAWHFDGRSEDLIKNGGAIFYQTLKNSKGKKWFWYGTYQLSENSGYSNGILTVTYLYGFNLDTLNNVSFDDLIADVDNKMETYKKDASYDYVTENSSKIAFGCTCDIEKFTFELGNAKASGYTSMTCTEKSWKKSDSETVDYCEWGVKSRSFDLVSD